MNFTASEPEMPLNLTLRAKLAWIYFFTGSIPQLEASRFSWEAIHTDSGSWIITDEACDLDTAQIFPDEESFIDWLESTASSHLSDDPVGFLQNFVSVRDLITPEVAAFIVEKVLNP